MRPACAASHALVVAGLAFGGLPERERAVHQRMAAREAEFRTGLDDHQQVVERDPRLVDHVGVQLHQAEARHHQRRGRAHRLHLGPAAVRVEHARDHGIQQGQGRVAAPVGLDRHREVVDVEREHRDQPVHVGLDGDHGFQIRDGGAIELLGFAGPAQAVERPRHAARQHRPLLGQVQRQRVRLVTLLEVALQRQAVADHVLVLLGAHRASLAAQVQVLAQREHAFHAPVEGEVGVESVARGPGEPLEQVEGLAEQRQRRVHLGHGIRPCGEHTERVGQVVERLRVPGVGHARPRHLARAHQLRVLDRAPALVTVHEPVGVDAPEDADELEA